MAWTRTTTTRLAVTSLALALAGPLSGGGAPATAAPGPAAAPGAVSAATSGGVPMASPAGPVTAIPAPGSVSALPTSDIELRSVSVPGSVRLTVKGSRSGGHDGTLTTHPDGRGLTWHPRRPFVAGEVVTVDSSVAVHVPAARGSRASTSSPRTTSTWGFTVATPAEHPGVDPAGAVLGTPGAVGSSVAAGAALARSARTNVAAASTPVSRPDLRIPGVSVTTPASGTQPGLLLATPVQGPASDAGVLVYDDAGQPVWFHTVPGKVVGNADVQTYQGQPVLSWFEGTAPYVAGNYRGEWVLADSSYTELRRLRMGNGYQADIHDLRLTPQGTALMVAYNPLRCDNVTITGCTTGAVVLDGVIQEVDIATGTVLFEWHALDHFSLGDSYESTTPGVVDYIHINSLDLDTDGNILFSARHTSALTKIDRSSGDLVWVLGGKQNDFRYVGDPETIPGPDYPHDLRARGGSTYSYFDNGVRRQAADPSATSRAVVVTLDVAAGTATWTTILRHRPVGVFGPTQGRVQELGAGHNLVAWGGLGLVDELDQSGNAVFSAQLAAGTYRQVRRPWVGAPATAPAAVVTGSGPDRALAVSWNGDSRTVSWQLLSGPSPQALAPRGSVARTGFETRVPVPADAAFVAVRALDGAGNPLAGGRTTTLRGSTTFAESTSPAQIGGSYLPLVGDFGGSRNADVFYYAPGAGGEYLHVSDGSGGFTSTAMPAVNATYAPLVGDFVGDDRDEVLWVAPGSSAGYLWRFDRGARTATPTVQTSPVTLPGAAQSFVLDHRPNYGGSKDEVFFYAPGPGYDAYVAFVWDAGKPLVTHPRGVTVGGTYTPVVGDFDNNGLADIFWYGAGSTPDSIWLTSGGANGSTGHRAVPASVSGTYTVLAADVSGDDGAELVFWAPGSGADFVWSVDPSGAVSSRAVTTDSTATPLVLPGSTDALLLWERSTSGVLATRTLGTVPVTSPTGNTSPGPQYQPLVGDFVGAGGTSSVLWYAPGASPELLYVG